MSWTQTEIETRPAASLATLVPGAEWRWHGEAICLDALMASGRGDTTACVISAARKVLLRALAAEGRPVLGLDARISTDKRFTLTDGRNIWQARLIEMPGFEHPFLLFAAGLPPASTALRIRDAMSSPHMPVCPPQPALPRQAVLCFTPGTLIETPKGAKPVEELVAGDPVTTKDNGTRPVLWVGSRTVSGARLHAMPELRPVRFRAGAWGQSRSAHDLLLSPDHHVLMPGPAPHLVPAKALIDGRRILRDTEISSLRYIHLMLEQHQIVIANGVEVESFLPMPAALGEIGFADRQKLFDVMPVLAINAHSYGPPARPLRQTAEMPRLLTAA